MHTRVSEIKRPVVRKSIGRDECTVGCVLRSPVMCAKRALLRSGLGVRAAKGRATSPTSLYAASHDRGHRHEGSGVSSGHCFCSSVSCQVLYSALRASSGAASCAHMRSSRSMYRHCRRICPSPVIRKSSAWPAMSERSTRRPPTVRPVPTKRASVSRVTGLCAAHTPACTVMLCAERRSPTADPRLLSRVPWCRVHSSGRAALRWHSGVSEAPSEEAGGGENTCPAAYISVHSPGMPRWPCRAASKRGNRSPQAWSVARVAHVPSTVRRPMLGSPSARTSHPVTRSNMPAQYGLCTCAPLVERLHTARCGSARSAHSAWKSSSRYERSCADSMNDGRKPSSSTAAGTAICSTLALVVAVSVEAADTRQPVSSCMALTHARSLLCSALLSTWALKARSSLHSKFLVSMNSA